MLQLTGRTNVRVPLERVVALCLAYSALVLGQSVQADASRAEPSLNRFLVGYMKEMHVDGDHTIRYSHAFVRLSGSDKKEAIVYLRGRAWCGSGGCTTLILSPQGDSYRIVTKIPVTNPPIRVLNSSTNGWHDLGIWVRGGGVQPGYEAWLRFSGKSYPSNPSVLPAVRIEPGAEGQPVIAESDSGLPLTAENETVDAAESGDAPGLRKPSFDCTKASTRTERLICSDRELAALDGSMASAYRKALDSIPTDQRAELRAEQSAWFSKYAKECNASASRDGLRACILRNLSERIDRLGTSSH